MLYDVNWPNREYASSRGARRTPLHDRHAAANAIMGGRSGWEVPLAYAPAGHDAALHCSYGRQDWVPWVADECRAAEEEVVLFDLSAGARLMVTGAAAVDAVARLSAFSRDDGLSTQLWLNDMGKVRATVSALRMSHDRLLLLSSLGTERLHRMWLGRQLPELHDGAIGEVTSATAAFLLLGPGAEALLAAAGARLPAGIAAAAVEIGYAPATVARTSIGAASGWLVVTPSEFASHAFEALEAVSQKPLRLGGAYALDALRIGAGQPAWPSELGDTVTPLQGGLGGKIAWQADFVGREALLRERDGGLPRTRLVRLTLAEDRGALYGQEGILRDGRSVGLVTSGAWCRHAGVPVALGYVSDGAGIDAAWLDRAKFQLDMPGGPAAVRVALVE